jgi:acyl-CoA thioester hydrolase
VRYHVEELRVRYGDTDQMGVVYYANYLRYFEVARAEWLRAGGLAYRSIEEESGLMLPVVETHVRYRAPARYDDLVAIRCAPVEVRAASARFGYEVRRGEQLLAEGWTSHACIDRDGRPRRFPQPLRALLLAE